jgi:hypothetical protein
VRRVLELLPLLAGALVFFVLLVAWGAARAPALLVVDGDPVITAAGDIAGCGNQKDEETAQLLDSIAPTRVLALGDNVYPDGKGTEYTNCYQPTWGRHKAKTSPVPGNHDYHVNGAAGYFGYYGAAAGDPAKGYYAFNLGSWRLYALNSNCSDVSCAAGAAQEQWLRADLAANPRSCSLAFLHHPRFGSGETGGRRDNKSVAPLYQAFYDASGDIWLSGHNHQYERLTHLGPNGAVDLARGLRIFIAGTGGAALYQFGTPITGSEVRSMTHGVLKLTLHAAGYEWQFVPIAGSTFTDSGSDTCRGVSNGPPVAVDDNLTTAEDTPKSVSVLANDFDPDGDPLTVTASTNGAKGTVACTLSGSCTYTPNTNANGPDSFTYTVSDGTLTDTGTVAVTITPVNDVADFDGNGTTDISLFRPSTGRWYVQNQPSVAFGQQGDVPVPGDYDGNGATELAFFRPSTGRWYVQNQPSVAFGQQGDIPLPLPWAIYDPYF